MILFPSVGTASQVLVAGRVLQEMPTEGTSVWSKNLRNLTASTWEGAPVEVGYDGLKAKVTSVKDGAFEVTFQAPKDKPFKPGTSTAEARVPGGLGRAPVTIMAADAPFLVISDFDDTIAVTNVLSKRSLLKSAFLKDAESTPVVEGMPQWYRCLVDDHPSKAGFAVVSGSPIQFTSRISGFMKKNDFPVGGLYLRNLGPDTLKDYKQPIIRALLQRIPNRVILVGDSGEHDPEVYKQIREEFPDRVAAIYIHNVGRDEDPARFKDMVLFKDPKDASKDAVKRELESADCHKKAFE